MYARLRFSVFAVTTAWAALAVGVLPVASADPSARAGTPEDGYVGIIAHRGYEGANGHYIDDFYFELPDAVAREVSLGSVIQPDDPSFQRVVVVEPHVGYCIDRARHAPTSSTRYRFNGMRDEVAAHVAIVARERGQVADRGVWAWRDSLARRAY